MEPILVTGAAGQARGDDAAARRRVQQGATGRRMTEDLLKLGYEVRAFVRVEDDRAAELRELGADVHVGDLRDITAVTAAMKGVKRAYFNYPVMEGMLEAVSVFASVARDEHVQRVIDVSMLAASTDPEVTPHMRRHWVAEQVFSGLIPESVHLEATVFYENMGVAVGNGGGRELPLPLGPAETEMPLVASADVARVGLALMTADEITVEPVVTLIGEVLPIGEVAKTFGVPYENVDPDEWRSRGANLYHGPASIEHLSSMWEMFKVFGAAPGMFQPTDDIEKITGVPAISLKEFVASR
jgi:uncharacterized protein YbjT (DUF2867 family)